MRHLKPVKYEYFPPEQVIPIAPGEIYIKYTGKDWAIRHNEMYTFEPMPSSRTDEFLENYRYNSPEEALEILKRCYE